ncbi:MAG: hypothetical protein Q8R10_14750 [Pseudomonas sp.]|uniref:hypothetical protein n=1 Tax=Pseudomonas sp. TaxID=306 RepID=UPI0027374055|nr:hypothetical protein [Pseudomonas sp.]MDP3847675.1 hypothetical protein [Pseudomonas sp.]
MRLWLGVALLSSGAVVAASLWLAAPPEVPVIAVASRPLVSPIAVAPSVTKPMLARVASPPVPAPPAAPAEKPAYSVAEAQMLMQVMAESGDPRQPVAGGLKPREAASPAQLASPEQYAAFEDQHARAEIQAWASGVQQIPQMREQIEQAAQSGERSSVEIDEARGALEQLEMLQSRLQREAPELLPGSAPTAKP